MNRSAIAIVLASSISLGACATRADQERLESAATGAAVGAAGGAAVGAVVPGVSTIEGAVAGAAIGGLAGAVWADNDGDGNADGYVREGQYYEGRPAGWDSTLGRVATGAAGGAVVGGVAGAVIPGVSVVEGAIAGAVIGGIAGAVWADQDKDGRVDGYVREGQYYPGTPAGYDPNAAPASTEARSGERG